MGRGGIARTGNVEYDAGIFTNIRFKIDITNISSLEYIKRLILQ
jgi:hypothetical protein